MRESNSQYHARVLYLYLVCEQSVRTWTGEHRLCQTAVVSAASPRVEHSGYPVPQGVDRDGGEMKPG